MKAAADYARLVARVDEFSARADASQRPWLQCRKGCDACCRTRRTAFAVEVQALRAHLATLTPARRSSLQARVEAPEVVAGQRCVYLDEDGACAVYDARPILCRTHGPAVRAAPDSLVWCELNFADLGPEDVERALDPRSVLDLGLVNQMLALVNVAHVAACGGPDRLDLTEALR